MDEEETVSATQPTTYVFGYGDHTCTYTNCVELRIAANRSGSVTCVEDGVTEIYDFEAGWDTLCSFAGDEQVGALASALPEPQPVASPGEIEVALQSPDPAVQAVAAETDPDSEDKASSG